MALEAGQQLLHYRLIEKIGEGGMGQVWRATDTTLDREVAIKVLPDALAQDAERLSRFEREAKLLATLNHPNIAGIYGIHEAGPSDDTVRFLSMELVPGEDLSQRLERGAIQSEEAGEIARQIAGALEAAHDQGIIHRDLKPANVKLMPDGTVKVLDFGLAKALDPTTAASGSSDPSASPTITSAGTVAGMILGTAAYMSPEQARGKPVDRRADIWSFGVVLQEMLSGERIFGGETISDTIAAVLRAEIDLDTLPAGTPRAVHHLLKRCLERDPRMRLQAIGEARITLESDMEPEVESTPAAKAGLSPAWVIPAIVLVAIAAFAGFSLGRGAGPRSGAVPATGVERLELPIPASKPLAGGSFLIPFAISPDGKLVVYVGVEQGIRRLYKRQLDSTEAEVMLGTEGAEGPFFSPDGSEVGFWAQHKIKRVPLAGGLPRVVRATIDFRGATWGANDTIVFTPHQEGVLWTISADGGQPRQLTELAEGEHGHRLPRFLPDGRTLVFGIQTPRFTHETAATGFVSVDGGPHTTLLDPAGADVRYANGHLYHVQGSALLAVPMDPESGKITGAAVRVQEGVRVQANTGVAYFDIASDGTLFYLPGSTSGDDARVAWVDAEGHTELFSDESYILRHPRTVPGGARISVLFIGRERNGVWISDTARPGFSRIFDNADVEWAPDGRRAAIGDWNVRPRHTQIRMVEPFSGGESEMLVEMSPSIPSPSSFSPDGSVLLYATFSEAGDSDIMALHLEERRKEPFLATESFESGGRFSPDGKWVVYVSDETGRFEVYVAGWPGGGSPRQISTHGGREPQWSPDGREVYYRSGTNMMAVSLGPGPSLEPQSPRVLFEGPYEGLLGTMNSPNYAVHPDGRFLMLRSEELAAKMDRISVVRGALPGS